MANLQAIKRRIKSVQNTRQITKAMEMVAASKMRRAQEATLRSRKYTLRITEINERLAGKVDVAKHDLFTVRPVVKRLYVFFTSDQGLAGAYNANLTKELLSILEADKAAGVTPHLIVIGKKGAQLVSRLENVELVGVYENWPTNPSVADVAPILQQARAGFTDGSYDEVTLIYTEFFSMIKQVVTQTKLLPLAQPVVTEDQQQATDKQGFEPSPQAVLEAVVPRLVEAQLIQAAYEASASEQSMRMVAMKNASDNANDLIDDFTLAYNGARQAGITQELAEISAGAEAIN
jgi:F-type H+-transporting ATPase subunit gamma